MKKLVILIFSLAAFLSCADGRRNRVVDVDDDDGGDEKKPWYENVMESDDLSVSSLLKCGETAWDWKGKYSVPDVLGESIS